MGIATPPVSTVLAHLTQSASAVSKDSTLTQTRINARVATPPALSALAQTFETVKPVSSPTTPCIIKASAVGIVNSTSTGRSRATTVGLVTRVVPLVKDQVLTSV